MARPDPRVDPSSLPPEKAAAKAQEEHVAVSDITAPTSEVASEAESGVVAIAERAAKSVTSADPRVAALEPLVVINDWKAIAEKLGPVEEAGKLPPNLGLLAALAHNEATADGDPAARELSFRCVAALVGMSEDSEIVRVLARRLLRKNPVRFRERKAPPARTSALIVFIVLAVGAGVGWFLSSGTFNRLLHH